MSKLTDQIEQRARELARRHIPSKTAEIYWDGDNYTQSEYVGSILNITPSGKFYLPFACSNVDRCPFCKEGQIVNPRARIGEHRRLSERLSRQRGRLYKQHGPHCEGRWPEGELKRLWRFEQRKAYISPIKTCPHCNGVGSIEAYHDEVFNETLSDEAGLHGCYVTGSDGDGCDVFIARSLEHSEVALLDICNAADATVITDVDFETDKGPITTWFAVGSRGELGAGIRPFTVTPSFKTQEELAQHCLENHEALLKEILGDEFDEYEPELQEEHRI